MTAPEAEQTPSRSGMVAVVGRPNVGKSTLVNALVGSKISIVSRRPQTTRHRIQGVCTQGDVQIVFVDTPGLHGKAQRELNRSLNRAADEAMDGVDAVLQVVEAGQWRSDDALAQRHVERAGVPVVLAVNKVDRIRPRQKLLPELQVHAERFTYHDIVPVSAEGNENLDRLTAVLGALMPEGPLLYPPEQRCGHGLDFTITECVREKLTLLLSDELPYAVTVTVEAMEDRPQLLRAQVVVWVERESQRRMVIGRGAEAIKRVGMAARRDLEARLGRKVYLETHVRVREKWSDDPKALRQLGYE